MVDDAEALRELLLQGVTVDDAHEGRRDAYGQRYNVNVPLEWRGKQITIRCGWIIEGGNETPRLTT